MGAKRLHRPVTESTATDVLKCAGCCFILGVCLIAILAWDMETGIRDDRWFPIAYGFGAISIFGIIRYGYRIWDKLNPII